MFDTILKYHILQKPLKKKKKAIATIKNTTKLAKAGSQKNRIYDLRWQDLSKTEMLVLVMENYYRDYSCQELLFVNWIYILNLDKETWTKKQEDKKKEKTLAQ